jgi:hypothetical protein
MNYEEDIKIDPTALDVEWLRQPELMIRYAKHSARMRIDLDEKKQALDIARAEADQLIRSNPEKYIDGKVTETAITNCILVNGNYKAAQKAFSDAKFESDMAQAAVNAFEQRKSALENLVRLHGQQYFAGPKMPRDLKWEWEEKQKEVNAGISKKLQRRPLKQE